MRVYKNLTIIGTSHIAKESIFGVKKFILEEKPEIIALELDKNRLFALFEERKPRLKDIREIGLRGFIINLIGAYVEKKLGKLVGVSPGAEMRLAVSLAKERGLKIALIDRDILITLKRLSKKITMKEKLRILKDLFKAIILRKKEIELFDLRKVPEEKTIDKLIRKVKKDYPNIYEVLIKERDEYMSKALYKIMNENKEDKILAIIGAGHERGVYEILQRD